ncbi:small glutamine-rich tetratricopeptide repeat-containing protein [Tanacetum coccineum]
MGLSPEPSNPSADPVIDNPSTDPPIGRSVRGKHLRPFNTIVADPCPTRDPLLPDKEPTLANTKKIITSLALQSKLYPAAIECYNVAIAFGGDNAIYYCNRAAAYIQTCQYAEAILDCQKSIAIDPNYIKAYTRLGYIYFVQGIGALEKGYRIATLLHPSVRENVRAAEHKIWQQREESGQVMELYKLNIS